MRYILAEDVVLATAMIMIGTSLLFALYASPNNCRAPRSKCRRT
jgi:hypothetical protein